MENYIYFSTTDGGLVTNYELAHMAYVINGDCIDVNDLESIRKYATNCKGISKEVIPSIKVCLKNGYKFKAVMIYRDRHPGMSIKEAKDAIDDMERKLKLGILE